MRIAIVRLTSLGDVVHTLPVAAAIRRQRPADRIIWVVEEHEQVLLQGNPAVDEVVVAPLRRWKDQLTAGKVARAAREIGRLSARLRALRIDVTLDVQGWAHKTSPIVAMTRAHCFRRGFCRLDALLCAENQLWLDLLKVGFNCRDLPHTGYRTRIHPW